MVVVLGWSSGSSAFCGVFEEDRFLDFQGHVGKRAVGVGGKECGEEAADDGQESVDGEGEVVGGLQFLKDKKLCYGKTG